MTEKMNASLVTSEQAPLSPSSNIPTNTDFATEVKTDRLTILYRATGFVAFVMLALLLTVGASQTRSWVGWELVSASVILVLGSLLTQLLMRFSFSAAAWGFALSGIVAVGTLIYSPAGDYRQIAPFAMPLVVFVIGLLLAPSSTVLVALLASLAIVVAPSLQTQTLFLSAHSFIAILFTFLAALLAAQVTGELYQITEWALQNYRSERKTNDELFEKRQALTMSLKRSEALADKLQELNVDLERARATAEEAKTFRGQFLANMSHELRTPLNAIIGFSETMLQFPIMYDDIPLPEAYERDLTQIYNSGRQLLFIINDILDLAKVDAGKLELHIQAFDPLPVVNAALSTAKGLIGKRSIQLERDFSEPLPIVQADETRLRQVLLNLYSNAVKYTDSGYVRLSIREEDDALVFALKDTGIGIDPEFHDKLFQEFQQAKAGGRDPRSGSGLGLAISRQLLTLMGGKIWMESQVGQGSTFYFSVPLYRKPEANPDERERSNLRPPSNLAQALSTSSSQQGS